MKRKQTFVKFEEKQRSVSFVNNTSERVINKSFKEPNRMSTFFKMKKSVEVVKLKQTPWDVQTQVGKLNDPKLAELYLDYIIMGTPALRSSVASQRGGSSQFENEESSLNINETRRYCCCWFSTNSWILHASLATLFFSLCNEAISEVAFFQGPLCLFYFSTGSVITGLIYNVYKAIGEYKKRGVFWNGQNLIVGGSLRWSNLFGFLVFMIQHLVV